MGGRATTTQKSTTAPAPEAMDYYKQLMNRLQSVGKLGYTPYSGERVAGFTPYQEQAMQGVKGLQGAGMGTLQEAIEAGRRGAAPLTAADIQRYQDPYQKMVVDAMSAQMRQQEAEDISKLQGTSISSGAFGGDRAKLAQTQLMRNQEQERNYKIADLMSKGYSQSLAAARADQEAAARGAQNLSSLASQEYNLPASQLQALYGAGAQQQQLEQQRLNVPYQTYLEQRAFPYQQLQYLAGLGTGIGSQMGGSSYGETTQPKPNMWSQLGGLALSVGLAPFTGGMSLAAAPGMMAGMGRAEGGRITKPQGGGISTPYSGASTGMFEEGFIPELSPVKGQGAPGFSSPQSGGQDNSSANMIDQAMSLAEKLKGSNDQTNPASWATTTTLSPENPASWATSVNPVQSMSPMSPSMLFPTFADGGGVDIPHYDNGGGAEWNPLTADPRIASIIESHGLTPKEEKVPEGINRLEALSNIAAKMKNSRSLDKKEELPAKTTEAINADLPPIEVPQKKETPSAGIDKSYTPPEAGATKGSSILGSLLGLSPEAEQAGMLAGLAIAAGQSPYALSNIGSGGMAGMKYYNDLVRAKQEQALKEKELTFKSGKENLVKTDSVTENGEPVFINKNTGESVDIRGNPIGPDTPLLNVKEYLTKKKSEAKTEADLPKAQSRLSTQAYENQRAKEDLKKAKEKIGYFTTGLLGVPLSKIPGTSAADLAEDIKSIQARLGFEQLQTMRQNSPTGGALGNVSNQEIAYLQAAVQSLSTNQSPEQLREKFDEIATHLNRIEEIQKQAFAQQYGEDKLFETLPTTGETGNPPNVSSKEEFDKLPSGAVFFNAKTNRLEKK